jgi:hypothetical protein
MVVALPGQWLRVEELIGKLVAMAKFKIKGPFPIFIGPLDLGQLRKKEGFCKQLSRAPAYQVGPN